MIKEITINNKFYPTLLKQIKEPPIKLYLIGNEQILNTTCFSIVGSRICSNYGTNVTLNFSSKLSKNNFTIISGMAVGIDTAAHVGCIKAKGKTIAVLGSGFNHIFPEENIPLFNEIIKTGGAIITEYEPNEEPKSKNFPRRNRIVSGMSIGTLVVEAGYRSGATITGGLSLKQNKKVFGVPSNIENRYNAGTNMLINKGAKLVTTVEDILIEYDMFNKKDSIKQLEIIEDKKYITIPKEYVKVYTLISEKPIHIDTICRTLGEPANLVGAILTMLELEEYIKQLPGKNFVLL